MHNEEEKIFGLRLPDTLCDLFCLIVHGWTKKNGLFEWDWLFFVRKRV